MASGRKKLSEDSRNFKTAKHLRYLAGMEWLKGNSDKARKFEDLAMYAARGEKLEASC